MYIPKNKIITNLYSENNDLVYKSNNQVYKGYYYKTYQGKYFTGKNPDDKPNKELIYVEPTETDFVLNSPQTKIAYTDAPTIFEDINTPGYDERMIIDYAQLKEINLNKSTYKNLPFQHYPIPTEDDYKLGVFTRYFCVKNNENIYLELNKDTYDKLVKQDENWSWQLYTPFSILWTITGEENEVKQTNENTVLLQERRSKRDGLQLFLRKNYLKFYRPDLETQS